MKEELHKEKEKRKNLRMKFFFEAVARSLLESFEWIYNPISLNTSKIS